MEISLWAALLDRPLEAEEADMLTCLLPEERLERLKRLRLPERRQEPLCAYALLSVALFHTYGWIGMPEMRTGPQGKPFFPFAPGKQFNLSHTRGAVLAAVSGVPVGVDIERVRHVSRRTMERVAGADTGEEFFRTWVRREARAKRDGTETIGTLLTEKPPLPEERYWEIETFPGYIAGVAACASEEPADVRRFTVDGLLEEAETLTFYKEKL